MIHCFCCLRFLLGYVALGLLAGGAMLSTPAEAQRTNPPQAGLGVAWHPDGTDDYLAISGMSYSGSPTTVTVEAWVRTTDAGNQVIASFDESHYWSLEMIGGRVVWKVAGNPAPEAITLSGATLINDGQWHHVAAVYDHGRAALYINGVPDGAITQATGTSFGSGATRFGFVGAASLATAFNGAQGATDLFAGGIDEVRVWSVARTAAEIDQGRFSQLSGTENNLAFYYDFENGSGTTAIDRSPNGYDGTCYNATDATWFAGNITLGNAIPDQVAVGGEEFPNRANNTFPATIFSDDAIASYQATLVDGPPLPNWLHFNSSNGQFAGTPPNLPASYIIRLTATDTDGHTADDIFTLLVRAVPSVTLDAITAQRGYEAAFTEGDPPVDITATDVTIADPDNIFLTGFDINLLNNISEDTLILTTEGKAAASAAGISVQDYNSVSGSIILTGLATLDEYAEVLEWVQYYNRLDDPTTGTRIVSFIATDQDSNTGSAASLVLVNTKNDRPTLDLDGSSNSGSSYVPTYTEDSPPVPIVDHNVTLSDIDYHDFGSVTIAMINRPDTTQETLQTIGSLPTGISAFFHDTTGVLELRGTASLDAYEEAIQQIGYHNASQNPDLTPRELLITFDDGDGGESTGSATVRVNIIPVNDPPDTQMDTMIVAEYSRDNVVVATLPTDIDNELTELTITVVSLPDLGTLTYPDGMLIRVGDALDSAQFVTMQYDTPDNYDGVSNPGNLVYRVFDGGASKLSTVTFIINNAPEADDFIVTTTEDANYVFTLADFANGYSDVEGDPLAYVVISSLPANGLLLLVEDTVQIGDEIRITALDSGKLVLQPDLNANGNPYTSFLFRVKDDRAATSGLYVSEIVVTPVSDPPAVDTVFVSGEEYVTLFFAADDFIRRFSDPENDTLTKIRIESLPGNGTLLLNDEPVTVGDEIPIDDLPQLAFEPDAGFDGVTEFRWNGHDGSAYAALPAPVIITILEDNRLSAMNDTIRLIDVTTYDGTLTALVNNPTGGDFTFRTNPVVDPEHGRIRLYDDGTYTYQTTAEFTGTDTFTFEVCNTNNPPECARATVTIIMPPPLLVYEGFSPDNDGTNDVWRIRGIENYPNNHVRIFNRWGNLVFEMAGYDNYPEKAWSSYSTAGLVAGDVPDGTYFYLIDLGNGQPPRSGYVIVNR